MKRKKRNKWSVEKAHLATWDDENIDSRNEEENEEEALLCLMVMECENIKVNELDSNALNIDINDLYSELYEDLMKVRKNLSLSKKIIGTLEIDVEVLQKENELLGKKNWKP